MVDISIELSKIRKMFLNIQNKAEFSKSAKALANTFKDLLTIEGYFEDSKITMFSSKKKVIFKIDIDEKSFICILKKDEGNYADIFDYDKFASEKNGTRFTDIIEISNSEIAKSIINVITNLFTGRNFDILENYGN